MLQETIDRPVFAPWGAEKWYVYVLDSSGAVRFIHYKLSLPDEEERFLSEIEALLAEGAR